MTPEEFRKHLESVGAGPRSEKEIAEAERKYQARVFEGRAELAAAELEARRAPGAPPLSRLAGFKASLPSFTQDIAALPEVGEVEEVPAPIAGKNGRNGDGPPLDRDMLRALGQLFVETKKQRGKAQAWEEIVDALMVNLHRLAPGYGTIKDIISLARSLDEYSNPVASNGKGSKDKTSMYRKALLMDEGE